jgi:two-component system NtrC family sensor kinase
LVSATLSLTLGNRVIIANRKLRLQHRMSQILEEKLEQLTRELSEAQDQLKATSEVLRIISSSPADVALALGTIAESAARLLDVTDATIMRVDGEVLRCMANHGPSP